MFVSGAPEQLPTSVELPVHGVVPFVKLLVLFLFASLSHVPKQVPQAFQADHEPSTKIIEQKIQISCQGPPSNIELIKTVDLELESNSL